MHQPPATAAVVLRINREPPVNLRHRGVRAQSGGRLIQDALNRQADADRCSGKPSFDICHWLALVFYITVTSSHLLQQPLSMSRCRVWHTADLTLTSTATGTEGERWRKKQRQRCTHWQRTGAQVRAVSQSGRLSSLIKLVAAGPGSSVHFF